MDQKKYQQLLEAVAEVEYSEDDAGPVVKKLKCSPHVCPRPNCGKIIERDHVISTYYELPQRHWRSNCKDCLCYLNPYTGEPLHGNKATTAARVNSLVRQHYKQLRIAQGLELADEEIAAKLLKEARVKQHDDHVEIVIEDEESTITRYVYASDK